MKNGSAAENNNLLKKADYEKYQLVLPYRFMFGRKRQRFIYSELEKLHPCFSEEFCFDSSIRKVSKKGLVSDVLVIHKYTLAEYEAGRQADRTGSGKIVGTGFCVDFCKRRFFKNEKVKRADVVVVLATFLFLMLFLILGFYQFQKAQKTLSVKKQTMIETENLSDGVEIIQPSSLMEVFFEGIKNADGRIISFRWEQKAGIETLDARIKGVYPEQINELNPGTVNMGAVNYENGLPVIQISEVQKLLQEQISKSGNSLESVHGDFFQNNRNVLFENSASLKDEKLSPYLLHFVCNEKVLRNLIMRLAENYRASGDGKVISSICIVSSAGGGADGRGEEFEISIGGIEDAASALCDGLSLLGEHSDLFGESPKALSVSKSTLQTPKKEIKEVQKSEISDAAKIGEIKNSEGKVISFYKTSEGKIKKVMEEQ